MAPSARRRGTPGRRLATLSDVTAVLEASVGDRLHAVGLAGRVGVVQAGRPVPPSAAGLSAAFPRAQPRVAVSVHGLGVTEVCVYVCDRLVLPALSTDEVRAITEGEHSMDVYCRRLIHETMGYRYVCLPDGAAAREVERQARGGRLAAGTPLLNALRTKSPRQRSTAGRVGE